MENLTLVRTVNDCAKTIRKIDPESAVCASAIRKAIKSGGIPARQVGTRFLVSVDAVLDYFSGKC